MKKWLLLLFQRNLILFSLVLSFGFLLLWPMRIMCYCHFPIWTFFFFPFLIFPCKGSSLLSQLTSLDVAWTNWARIRELDKTPSGGRSHTQSFCFMFIDCIWVSELIRPPNMKYGWELGRLFGSGNFLYTSNSIWIFHLKWKFGTVLCSIDLKRWKLNNPRN